MPRSGLSTQEKKITLTKLEITNFWQDLLQTREQLIQVMAPTCTSRHDHGHNGLVTQRLVQIDAQRFSTCDVHIGHFDPEYFKMYNFYRVTMGVRADMAMSEETGDINCDFTEEKDNGI